MEYNTYKLKEIATILNGRAYKQHELLDSGKYKVLRVGNFFTSDTWYYSDLELEENKYCNNGDLLFAWSANFGPKIWNEDKTIYHYHIWKFELTNKVDKYFLYYYLHYITRSLKNNTHGSVMMHLTKFEMENLNIKLPNLDTQKKIGHILHILDEKIILNNQTNDNLYEICKNLYKNYFTDKVDIKWQVDKLGNYLTVDRGLSYKGKFLSDAGIPMINLGNVMPNGTFRIEKNKYYIGEYKDKVTAKVGDIVIANTDMTQNREVIGTPVIIPPLYDNDIIFSHHIYCLRNLKLPKMYLFYTLLTDEWNGVAGGNATGTTVLALPKETIENYKIYIPDESTLNNFENVAMKIQQQRDNILLENINLEKLRDTLLPKLMNGEIDLDKIEI